jgi:enamine deaminase RidA (YjgF/YER057c/UK114 family)
MGLIEDRLAERGLELPAQFRPPEWATMSFPWVRVEGQSAFISGHGPLDGDDVLVTGKVGGDVTLEDGYEAARLTALAMLSSLKHELGELDRVRSWIRVLGVVNAARGFNGSAFVLNGFSDLIIELWGEQGRHARSSLGAAELPFDMAVEVEAVVGIAP